MLALDSSADSLSLAFTFQGRCYQRFQVAPRQHAQLLIPLLRELAQEIDPRQSLTQLLAGSVLVVSRGPATSFTGIRLAMSFAQGLAAGLKLPIIPISTPAGLALQWLQQASAAQVSCLHPQQRQRTPLTIWVVIDGKMQSLYYSVLTVAMGDGDYSLLAEPNEAIMTLDELIKALLAHPPDLLLLDEQLAASLMPCLPAQLPQNLTIMPVTTCLQAQYLIFLAQQKLQAAISEGAALDYPMLLQRFSASSAVPHYLRPQQFWHKQP